MPCSSIAAQLCSTVRPFCLPVRRSIIRPFMVETVTSRRRSRDNAVDANATGNYPTLTSRNIQGRSRAISSCFSSKMTPIGPPLASEAFPRVCPPALLCFSPQLSLPARKEPHPPQSCHYSQLCLPLRALPVPERANRSLSPSHVLPAQGITLPVQKNRQRNRAQLSYEPLAILRLCLVSFLFEPVKGRVSKACDVPSPYRSCRVVLRGNKRSPVHLMWTAPRKYKLSDFVFPFWCVWCFFTGTTAFALKYDEV